MFDHGLPEIMWKHAKQLQFKRLSVHFYRLQRSCGKVMVSQACVKNSVHRGCIPACTGADTPLWADTPLDRPPPPMATPAADGMHPDWNAFLFQWAAIGSEGSRISQGEGPMYYFPNFCRKLHKMKEIGPRWIRIPSTSLYSPMIGV